jgi:aspartate-semialdehyde dehydrogenase
MQAAAAVRHPHLLAPSAGRSRRRPSTVRMALREDGPSVAIVGATGAVGQEFLRVITDRDFPYRSLRLLASERSAGKRLAFEDREYTVQDLAAPGAFDDVDIALFSAGGGVSRKFGPAAVASGAVVVDNSSAFRMDPEVPLVIPEVNPEAMANVRLGQGAIVANPNCSTIICLMAATPLHRHAKVHTFGHFTLWGCQQQHLFTFWHFPK